MHRNVVGCCDQSGIWQVRVLGSDATYGVPRQSGDESVMLFALFYNSNRIVLNLEFLVDAIVRYD